MNGNGGSPRNGGASACRLTHEQRLDILERAVADLAETHVVVFEDYRQFTLRTTECLEAIRQSNQAISRRLVKLRECVVELAAEVGALERRVSSQEKGFE